MKDNKQDQTAKASHSPKTKKAVSSSSRFFGQNTFFSPSPLTSSEKLPEGVRGKMESFMGEDFSNVRIRQASPFADRVGALAFTQGEQIHFASNRYNPNTQEGQTLIGHELAHVSQQRQGRVPVSARINGFAVNTDRALENEAHSVGVRAARGHQQGIGKAQGSFSQAPSSGRQAVTQFALPAAVAAMGAAEWIAVGALGYSVANDASAATSGDVSYTFDEVEGVLLPGGGNDVQGHKAAHPNAQIYEATHQFSIWVQNRLGSKLLGLKFGITFLYDDAGAIGNISLGILDMYDWPGYGGKFDVNITPRSLGGGNASFRFTINVTSDKSWFTPDLHGNMQFVLRGGDGDLGSVVRSNEYFRYDIS